MIELQHDISMAEFAGNMKQSKSTAAPRFQRRPLPKKIL
jgi:hypothetical protein